MTLCALTELGQVIINLSGKFGDTVITGFEQALPVGDEPTFKVAERDSTLKERLQHVEKLFRHDFHLARGVPLVYAKRDKR